MTISIDQKHPMFVGEVDGVKLSPDMDDAVVAAVDEAINKFAVLIFHDLIHRQQPVYPQFAMTHRSS